MSKLSKLKVKIIFFLLSGLWTVYEFVKIFHGSRQICVKRLYQDYK